MKFCEKCGKELADDAVVCMGCGCAVVPVVESVTEVPKGPFHSKKSVIATVLGGIGVVLPFLGIALAIPLGVWSNMLLSGACIAASVIGLVLAIKALRERTANSDTLALIALFIAIGGIVVSTVIGLIYTVLTVIWLIFIIVYGGTILSLFGFLWSILGLVATAY